MQIVAGQVSRVGSGGFGVRFQKTSLQAQAVMTLLLDEQKDICKG